MAMTIDPSSKMSVLPSYQESRQRMQALNAAAASYLGMSKRDLRTQLEAGKSLAEMATERGKSVDGLRQAMRAADPGTSGNGGINAMGFVDRIINAHSGQQAQQPGADATHQHHGRPRGPAPISGPAVDPAPPVKGEGGGYHTLPIKTPGDTPPYHTLPIESPSFGSPYHTTGADKKVL